MAKRVTAASASTPSQFARRRRAAVRQYQRAQEGVNANAGLLALLPLLTQLTILHSAAVSMNAEISYD